MRRSAIIFGSTGQDGKYLASLLESNGVKVHGVSRSEARIIGDISNKRFVDQLISEIKPDWIFHFAAISTTNYDVLFENHDAVCTGTLNVLDSVFKHSRHSKVFLSGSALQFENKGSPIDESSPFAATSPYSMSRIQSVYTARYFRSLGIKVYVGYFFHHDSPYRTEKHLSMKIAKTALRILNGSNEELEIGDFNVVKEFNYAGDIVRAVWLMVNQETEYELVIGSGVGYSIRQWLDACFGQLGLDPNKFVKLGKDYVPEFSYLVSNPSKLYRLGWQPQETLESLATMMMGTK